MFNPGFLQGLKNKQKRHFFYRYEQINSFFNCLNQAQYFSVKNLSERQMATSKMTFDSADDNDQWTRKNNTNLYLLDRTLSRIRSKDGRSKIRKMRKEKN